MISRRDCLKYTMLAGAATALPGGLLQAMQGQKWIKRKIPKTGEELPIVGLGSSASFRQLADAGEIEQLRDVIKTLLDNGGSVFDTAPGYGRSEEVAGRIIQQLGATDDVFWATKLNVVPRGGNSADPAEARAQLERSFDYIGKNPIDLVQVHNLADVPTQMAILKEQKAEGRIRYIGTTYTGESRYNDLAAAMKNEPLDFVGVDYAVDNRNAAQEIFPIAEDLGIAVLVYLPFGRSRLWSRVGDRPIPDWATEIGIKSWAQFFIKYAAAHPAVTAVTPATSKPHHMLDNLGAGVGELPDKTLLKRMADYVDGLPSA
ncbi:MAG TPA: aldo/keto reductase [Woeseiaceae bacterium]|nr:aldo/keto reductase [Woeseiaceae bacterium]